MALDWMTPEQKAQLASQVNPATAAKAGWLPAPPVASSPAELLGIVPAGAPVAAPANPLLAAVAPAPVAPPPPAEAFVPKMVAHAGDPTPVSISPGGGPALLPNVPVVGGPAPVPAGPPPPMLAKPGTPASPFHAPSGGGGGPALPLQPPAPPPEGLYHGMDPLKIGTPGQQKLAVIEGQQLHGQGEYAKQGAAVDAGLAGDYEQQAQVIAADADKRAADAERKAADRKAFLAKYNADTEKQIDEYAKAEIKPDRLWAGEAGTANAVSAVIGAFASGLAGYLDPSKDYVGQFANRIEQKIAQDIEVQKANIAKRGAGIEARRGLYGSYLQQFGQEDAAEAAAYETYLRKTKAQVDSYASKATSEKAKIQLGAMSAALDDRMRIWSATRQASGEAMIDQYQAQQEKARAAAAAAAGNEFKKRNEMVFKAQLGVAEERAKKLGGAVSILETPRALPNGTVLPAGSAIVLNKSGLIDMEGTEAAANATVTVNMPVSQPGAAPGFQTIQVNKGSQGEVAKMSAGYARAIDSIERMEKAAAMPGPWVGEKKAAYEAALADYTSNYAVAKGMGAVSADEGERIAKTVAPAPTTGVGYLSDAQKKNLAAQKYALSHEAAALGTSYGPSGVAGPAPLPLGAPVPAGK